jgi:YebC/PmpR family DNA-binding regulatory protein
MSGHSKWATIRRKKAATDAARGKVFTRLAREIITAARQGGGDPEGNARLRAAVLAARAENMPNANIERAIKRGTGELEGVHFEEATFEGYGPGGVAILIDVLTDNRNRTVSEIRHVLTRHHGSMGEAGSVAWMFTQRGSIAVDSVGRAEDALLELVLESGGEDLTIEEDSATVLTAPTELFAVREALEGKGMKVHSATLVRIPQSTIRLEGKDAEQLLKLLDALEEQDDVQRVSANFDIPDEILQAHGS